MHVGGIFSPVYLESQLRDFLVSAMKKALKSCLSEISHVQTIYEGETANKSANLEKVKEQLVEIEQVLNKCVWETPWTFKKVDPNAVICIQKSIYYFYKYGMETCVQEISEFNKKEKKRLEDKIAADKIAAD